MREGIGRPAGQGRHRVAQDLVISVVGGVNLGQGAVAGIVTENQRKKVAGFLGLNAVRWQKDHIQTGEIHGNLITGNGVARAENLLTFQNAVVVIRLEHQAKGVRPRREIPRRPEGSGDLGIQTEVGFIGLHPAKVRIQVIRGEGLFVFVVRDLHFDRIRLGIPTINPGKASLDQVGASRECGPGDGSTSRLPEKVQRNAVARLGERSRGTGILGNAKANLKALRGGILPTRGLGRVQIHRGGGFPRPGAGQDQSRLGHGGSWPVGAGRESVGGVEKQAVGRCQIDQAIRGLGGRTQITEDQVGPKTHPRGSSILHGIKTGGGRGKIGGGERQIVKLGRGIDLIADGVRQSQPPAPPDETGVGVDQSSRRTVGLEALEISESALAVGCGQACAHRNPRVRHPALVGGKTGLPGPFSLRRLTAVGGS